MVGCALGAQAGGRLGSEGLVIIAILDRVHAGIVVWVKEIVGNASIAFDRVGSI